MDCVLGVYTLITHMKTRQSGTKTVNIIEILKDLAIVQAIKTDIAATIADFCPFII